jgi:hypothetical protein
MLTYLPADLTGGRGGTIKPPIDEYHTYGDVRIDGVATLSLGWGETCERVGADHLPHQAVTQLWVSDPDRFSAC